MSERPRVAVRSELVREFLLAPLAAAAERHAADVLPAEVEQILEQAPGPAGLARRGYLARVAETELFEAARAPFPGLAERVAAGGPAQVALELAAQEPEDRSDPGGGAPSWQVPGPGGHIRHYLALQAIEAEGSDDRALKRCWLYGFLVRCCEEVETGAAA